MTQNPTQAKVQVVVKVLDVASGEPINGAM